MSLSVLFYEIVQLQLANIWIFTVSCSAVHVMVCFKGGSTDLSNFAPLSVQNHRLTPLHPASPPPPRWVVGKGGGCDVSSFTRLLARASPSISIMPPGLLTPVSTRRYKRVHFPYKGQLGKLFLCVKNCVFLYFFPPHAELCHKIIFGDIRPKRHGHISQ
jgi:hypothetical protein